MNILKIKQLIEESIGPIVEVGGPTLQGYELLKKYAIRLPGPLVITNVTKKIEVWNPDDDTFSTHIVDEVADIRQLPYDDNSIGIVLASNLAISAYDNAALDEALAEYSNPNEPCNNYHLFLYKESSRVLKEGGLLIQANPRREDYAAASHYDLEKIHTEVNRDTTVVFVKRTTTK